MKKTVRLSPEVQERAVRMVVETKEQHDSTDAGDRQARPEDGIEVVFPVATVRFGRAADSVLLRMVLDCLARRR